MPSDLLYFVAGAAAGLVVGAGLALLATRVIGLFRTPEEASLRREVAALRRRLERKDRAIDDMLRHAADLAGRIPGTSEGAEPHEPAAPSGGTRAR